MRWWLLGSMCLPGMISRCRVLGAQPTYLGGNNRRQSRWKRSDHFWPRFDRSEGVDEVSVWSTRFGLTHSSADFQATRIDPQPFRLLCRRLHLPLPLSHRTCRCGRQLVQFGHHCAACREAGVLGKRGFPLGREGGARVSTNVFVRNMDLAVHNDLDSRRLEVVADGLTFWRGAQLAIDSTMVFSFAPGRDHQTRKLLDEGRKPLTLNFLAKVGERASLSWQPKWAGVRRRLNSSLHWRKVEPRRCL